MSHGFARTKTLKGIATVDASTGYIDSSLIAPVAALDANLLVDTSVAAVTRTTGDELLAFRGGVPKKIDVDEFGNLSIGFTPALGDLLYWNGSAWVALAAGGAGTVLTMGDEGVPTWQ